MNMLCLTILTFLLYGCSNQMHDRESNFFTIPVKKQKTTENEHIENKETKNKTSLKNYYYSSKKNDFYFEKDKSSIEEEKEKEKAKKKKSFYYSGEFNPPKKPVDIKQKVSEDIKKESPKNKDWIDRFEGFFKFRKKEKINDRLPTPREKRFIEAHQKRSTETSKRNYTS